MQLRNLEVFCEVAARRSFSRAAEARGISQPAASQIVQQLEESLGVELIDRSVRPLGLTAAGDVLFDGARGVLANLRELADRVQAYDGRVTGRVRVAAIYSVGLLQMATFNGEFRDRYPEVRLEINYLHPDEVYSWVQRDQADLGIVSFPRDGGDIACIPWLEQPLCLVVPTDHPLAERESVELAEIDGEQFVGFTPDLTIRREIDRRLKRAKVSVNVVHQFDNCENIKRAVEIGAGAAIVPLPTVRREVDAGMLKALQLTGENLVRPLGIIHKRHKHLPTAAEKFVELLHESPPEPVDEIDSREPALAVG